MAFLPIDRTEKLDDIYLGIPRLNTTRSMDVLIILYQ